MYVKLKSSLYLATLPCFATEVVHWSEVSVEV